MAGRMAELVRMLLRRAPVAGLLVLTTAAAYSGAVLATRHVQELRDEGAVDAPRNLAGSSPAVPSRLRTEVAYTSLDAPGGAAVHSRILWDDAWFNADSTVYNHELAHTSAVLSALAYAESGYYQAGSGEPPYMEQALARLGFDEVNTESYRFRSEVADEVLNLFTDDTDAVAYTIARKRLQAPAGEDGGSGVPRDLIMVSVRGSYGSEWLSNLNMVPVAAEGSPKSGAAARGVDMDPQEASTGARQGAEGVRQPGDGTRQGVDGVQRPDESAHGTPADMPELPVDASLRERIAAAVQDELAEMQRDLAEFAEPLTSLVEEWLATAADLADLGGAVDAGTSPEHLPPLDGNDDHRGYFNASSEICHVLDGWIADSHRRGAEVSVLVVGHSRGGAIANLVASELNDQVARAGVRPDGIGALREVSAVYAYTFAAPATTMRPDARDVRYGNIFNIVNPSDIMPYMPLHAWGFERYGVDLLLPAVDDAGFDARYQVMQRAYKRSVGVESACDPRDARVIAELVDEVSERVESPHALLTPVGVASIVSTCALRIDPVRVLYGHYPSAYVAWLEATVEGDLSRG